jgi:hypothetical protein
MKFIQNLKIKNIQNRVLKITSISLLVLYALVITIVDLQKRPVTTIIAIEDTGTRVVTDQNDAALKKEKRNFVQAFISYLYAFNSSNFESRMSSAGDLMSNELWAQRVESIRKAVIQIQNDDLVSLCQIKDIQESNSNPNKFRAVIEVTFRRKLQTEKKRYAVDIEVKKSKRDILNPYDMEVIRYDENPTN